jgi:hypothetical protein
VPKRHRRRLPDGKIIPIRRKGALQFRADPETQRGVPMMMLRMNRKKIDFATRSHM